MNTLIGNKKFKTSTNTNKIKPVTVNSNPNPNANPRRALQPLTEPEPRIRSQQATVVKLQPNNRLSTPTRIQCSSYCVLLTHGTGCTWSRQISQKRLHIITLLTPYSVFYANSVFSVVDTDRR